VIFRNGVRLRQIVSIIAHNYLPARNALIARIDEFGCGRRRSFLVLTGVALLDASKKLEI
jgi:hypothetical protein